MKYRIVNCARIVANHPSDYLLKGELDRKVANCTQCKSQKTCKNGTRHPGLIKRLHRHSIPSRISELRDYFGTFMIKH